MNISQEAKDCAERERHHKFYTENYEDGFYIQKLLDAMQKAVWNEAVESAACAVRDTRWGHDGSCGAEDRVTDLLKP